MPAVAEEPERRGTLDRTRAGPTRLAYPMWPGRSPLLLIFTAYKTVSDIGDATGGVLVGGGDGMIWTHVVERSRLAVG